MIITVIPARGGSKRIPHKNVKPFFGKPMIAWSIEAAKATGIFDQIVVSTDNPEIGNVARKYGAATPFIRPAMLADDYTDTRSVIAHAIDQLRLAGGDQVCCLYATAPFVDPSDIVRGRSALDEDEAAYTFSVTSYPYPVQRALRTRPDGRIEMVSPNQFAARSQDLEPRWHDAGQFYWATAQTWLSPMPIFERGLPVVVPRHRVQDIDTPEDWERAELMFHALQQRRLNADRFQG